MAKAQQQQQKQQPDPSWDPGVVRYIITDSKGKESLQQQNCWHMGRFIETQTAAALASQCAKDEAGHYKFRVVS